MSARPGLELRRGIADWIVCRTASVFHIPSLHWVITEKLSFGGRGIQEDEAVAIGFS